MKATGQAKSTADEYINKKGEEKRDEKLNFFWIFRQNFDPYWRTAYLWLHFEL